MIARRLLLAHMGAATRAACDKPPGQPRTHLNQEITWSAEARRFHLRGGDLRVSQSWDFANGDQEFTGTGAELRHIPGRGLELVSQSADPILRSPAGLALEGAAIDLVLVSLVRQRAVGAWDGALYYATDRRSETARYMNYAFGGPPAEGRPSVLVYDMTRLAQGGGDWRRSTIDQLRLDTATAAGDVCLISQLALAQLA